ncbi:hypothetical protein F2P56_002825 [Juglans regia]|uniref:AIG1-type G domain-containing protein n=2 Tax=Juglans regia TaxID=51240 RepID=A0A833YDE3_JUGRE|nr:translocase of chloroplast 90, chloroplastic-like isoform X2 [Juglans regia]KAF5482236.1 hypothetical protein F2P56_002825 [Juglans regia]
MRNFWMKNLMTKGKSLLSCPLLGSARTAGLVALPDASHISNNNQDNQHNPSLQQVSVEDSYGSLHRSDKRDMDQLAKIEDLYVKIFRLLQRLGQSQDNLLVAKVLYRIHLATLIRAGEMDLKRVNLVSNRAKTVAAEQEAAGLPELDFSFRILVLGKTGVGKSATINSIYDQVKTMTDAFQPATDRIQEVAGMVNGIKITVIDTPGLLPYSSSNVRRNKKILLSVKRFIKKSPPDIVLYFERLDVINMNYSSFPLLKLITEVFGSAIWFNTILVMTHSSSALPEGPNGYPVRYESYVTQCTNLVQHHIHQAASNSGLENPVLLVENHPQCKKDVTGEKVLPNGQVWKSQCLLLCICTKVLSDVNKLLNFQDSIELGLVPTIHLPSLPHLLSSLLRRRSISSSNGMGDEFGESLLLDIEEEDEYDQLPPIRILTKSQFERLTNSQRKDHLDELDYREILYLKKQLKEEFKKQMENRLSKEENLVNDNNYDSQQVPPETLMLPDMAVPPSFDSDCPVHRYRCVVTGDQWLVRPVLDPQGMDHDVGFDGINLETAVEINRNVLASVTGQVSKDKQNFSIQMESAAAFTDPRGPTYCLGLDVQSSGRDMIYTVHSNTKLRSLKHNTADCGLSFTTFGKKYCVGAKIEDTIAVGKRLKFVVNAGRMWSPAQVAHGGSFEATLRGSEYPARNDNVSLTMTILSFNKEMVLGAGLLSEFQLSRSLRVSFNADLNSRKMGQVCIKTSSSEHWQIALVAAFTMFRAIVRRMANESSMEALEGG